MSRLICPQCGGSGIEPGLGVDGFDEADCSNCDGTGFVPEGT